MQNRSDYGGAANLLLIMKLRHSLTILIAGASALYLTSCGDEGSDQAPPSGNGDQAAAPEQSGAPAQVSAAPAQASSTFSTADITPWLVSKLGVEKYAQITDLDLGKADDKGLYHGNATISLNDDLYRKDFPPAEFNEERKLINSAANRANAPESFYMMQVGAPLEYITEEDRAAKPLPENLTNQLNALTELAQAPVYVLHLAANTTKRVPISYRAEFKDNAWQFSEFSFDGADMTQELNFTSFIPKAELPEGAAVLTPEFSASRKDEIRRLADAFNTEATAYIQTREEAARASLVQREAKSEEEARAVAEQAAAEEAGKQEWKEYCTKAFAKGALFRGEWVRGGRFGQLSLLVADVSVLDQSIQFFGSIFDTKLPAASLQVEGRCDLTKDENGASTVRITIYDGMYDPDQPTAEVYDAKDGYLELKLMPDGKLEGSMGCLSWQQDAAKLFNIKLSAQEPEKKASGK